MSIVYNQQNDVYVDTTNSHITSYGPSWYVNSAGQEVRGTPPATQAQQQPAQTAYDKRLAQKNAFTGWENDPTARADQEQWWDIYVQTGQTDSPEQVQLHKDAETALKAANPTY